MLTWDNSEFNSQAAAGNYFASSMEFNPMEKYTPKHQSMKTCIKYFLKPHHKNTFLEQSVSTSTPQPSSKFNKAVIDNFFTPISSSKASKMQQITMPEEDTQSVKTISTSTKTE